MTKRRVQGGEATSERRRRDGVYQKSARRTHAVLLPNHWRRARVSRASRAWQVRAIKNKSQVGGFTALRDLILPRVRTYHTKKPSRFVHALSARPLKVQGGRGFGLCADGIIKISPISLCSHPDAHLNLNREVCRSLTWHSSKSESALERFEPVAADKLRLDGSLAMFAPEGDGCLNRARREDAGGIHKAGTTLCDFCRAFRQ